MYLSREELRAVFLLGCRRLSWLEAAGRAHGFVESKKLFVCRELHIVLDSPAQTAVQKEIHVVGMKDRC